VSIPLLAPSSTPDAGSMKLLTARVIDFNLD
jgi:hypothetical protein